jgi:hypothetical protein
VLIEEALNPGPLKVIPEEVRKAFLAVLAAVADEDILFAHPMRRSHSDRCVIARLQRNMKSWSISELSKEMAGTGVDYGSMPGPEARSTILCICKSCHNLLVNH